MKRCSSLTAALLVVSTTIASADTHKVLVLQSEGRVESAQRAKIDAGVLKLAKSLPGADVSPGDTTMSDAAAAVGCKPDTTACREEIMGMLSVDELVYANLTAKPGGTEIEVHRAIKGGATTDAKMVLVAGAAPDKLDGIAPLFGGKAAAPAKTAEFVPPGTTAATKITPPPAATTTKAAPPTTAAPTTTKAVTTSPTPTTTPEPTPTTTTPGPVVDTAPPLTTPTPSVVTTTPGPVGPQGPVDAPNNSRRRLELGGMIGGGALVLIGFMCWGSANDIQAQIDDAPDKTKAQIDAIVDLEHRGDSYARWGNVLFLGGAIVGGVSTYFFIRDRRAQRHAQAARIAPTVFDHGAGLALTFGASP